MTEPLTIPADPAFAALVEAWPDSYLDFAYPRTRWLGAFEALLRLYYPSASSDQLTLTARNAAPFTLAKPGVP